MAKPATGLSKSVQISLRIDPVTNQLWEDTAAILGLSKVACMEMAVRKLARAEGIKERPVDPAQEGAEAK